ncbi:glycosyltransferase family 1 protein [Trichocoleus sp. FACHB-591]|uniref:glycosyltransferase family 1 protein n=1 Tax=Trichocoleus sp. FACHB-591 TaxID=2692872 RepID=UPI001682DBFF|nr:glycosyltransferase family 1 protein [Trichocoleus sp. FACHB-591]MBD2093920.1 glycosyltransferase family 1 protein [Trichocoleus sp. FACHB-591]
MKVLYLHTNQPDYLAESLLHGLRTLLGKNCVDVPRYDSLYAPLEDHLRSKLRGYGFTIYGLLEDIPDLAHERYFWQKDLNKYDLIVIANIWSQWEIVWDLISLVEPQKLVILDGSDTPAFFPYTSLGWRIKKRPWSYFVPISKIKYFKRELVGEGYSYALEKVLPYSLRRWVPLPQNSYPIAFSIPDQKVSPRSMELKSKDFPKHIVDSEVATKITGSSQQYPFSSEAEYYDDLTYSRFGITTKRAGWDCLRHYELAANGCVLCFRDLDLKPDSCAPHGLDSSNCLIYHNFDELSYKVSSLTSNEYQKFQLKTYEWISLNTTVNRAKAFLEICAQSL